MVNWYENEGQLLLEYTAVKEQYSQFEMENENDRLILKGEMRTNRGNYYRLKLVYSNNHPREEPTVFVENAIINGNWYQELPWFGRQRVHMYINPLRICWNDRNRAGTWDPQNGTALAALNTVAVWLFSYECYVLDNEEKWLGSDH